MRRRWPVGAILAVLAGLGEYRHSSIEEVRRRMAADGSSWLLVMFGRLVLVAAIYIYIYIYIYFFSGTNDSVYPNGNLIVRRVFTPALLAQIKT